MTQKIFAKYSSCNQNNENNSSRAIKKIKNVKKIYMNEKKTAKQNNKTLRWSHVFFYFSILQPFNANEIL